MRVEIAASAGEKNAQPEWPSEWQSVEKADITASGSWRMEVWLQDAHWVIDVSQRHEEGLLVSEAEMISFENSPSFTIGYTFPGTWLKTYYPAFLRSPNPSTFRDQS